MYNKPKFYSFLQGISHYPALPSLSSSSPNVKMKTQQSNYLSSVNLSDNNQSIKPRVNAYSVYAYFVLRYLIQKPIYLYKKLTLKQSFTEIANSSLSLQEKESSVISKKNLSVSKNTNTKN